MAAPCLLLVLFKYLLTSWPLQGCILTVLALDLSPVLLPSRALVTPVEVLSGLSGACGAVVSCQHPWGAGRGRVAWLSAFQHPSYSLSALPPNLALSPKFCSE